MAQLVDPKTTLHKGYSTINDLVREVETHVAYKGAIDNVNTCKLLEGHLPFTYLLRKANQEHHYFVSYVEAEGTIKHQQFRIDGFALQFQYLNAGSQGPHFKKLFEDLALMIHLAAMECSENDSLPLA